MSSLLNRREAISVIDPALLPKTPAPSGSAPTTTPTSARRLFGSPDVNRGATIPPSPLVTASGRGLGGVVSGIPAKMAAFQSGQFGSSSLTSTAPSTSTSTPSFLFAPSSSTSSNLFGTATPSAPKTTSFATSGGFLHGVE
uniref:Uncharacterized protein n=1 Tax=Caenorhabditis japonica TaxID=281687 RepID=A0A8R1I5V7_CAEJA